MIAKIRSTRVTVNAARHPQLIFRNWIKIEVVPNRHEDCICRHKSEINLFVEDQARKHCCQWPLFGYASCCWKPYPNLWTVTALSKWVWLIRQKRGRERLQKGRMLDWKYCHPKSRELQSFDTDSACCPNWHLTCLHHSCSRVGVGSHEESVHLRELEGKRILDRKL